MEKKIEQSLYDIILKNVPIVCVDIAIVRTGKVLLVRRNDPPAKGEWWFPGGRLQKNEALLACAKRKSKEETGLDGSFISIIYYGETMFNNGPDDIPVHSINFVYLMTPASGLKVKLNDSLSEYKWIDKVNKAYHPYIKTVLWKLLL